MLALWQTRVPTVGTFHSALDRSRVLLLFSPMVQPWLERLDARIAVSAEARRTVADHLGGDAFVIPNGVFVVTSATPSPTPGGRGGASVRTIRRRSRSSGGSTSPARGWACSRAPSPQCCAVSYTHL